MGRVPGASSLPVGALWDVPEMTQHVHDLVVHLERRGVDSLVRQIDLHPHHCHTFLQTAGGRHMGNRTGLWSVGQQL